jgi:prepilin-type N-terminal cleavage/methylation domain-containing protein
MSRSGRKRACGMTLVEVLVAVALGSTLCAMATSLWLFSSRSFVSMGNYMDLDARSRNALDQMSREVREASQVTGFQMTGGTKWFTVTNTTLGTGATFRWQASTRTLVCQKPGQQDRVCLTECDSWNFQPYQRSPQPNGNYLFIPATNTVGAYDVSICKLINMNWKCSREILGSRMNTESVQTAQVVLRNKQ